MHRLLAVALTLPAGTSFGSLAIADAALARLPYCAVNATTEVVACADTEAELASLRSASGYLGSAPAAVVTVARLYDATNRTGVYTQIDRSSGCDTNPDRDWGIATMPAGWNDRVSSFQGYASCEIKLWENGSFGAGLTYGPAGSANSLGTMDNRTSSFAGY